MIRQRLPLPLQTLSLPTLLAALLALCLCLPALAQFEPPLKRPDRNKPKTLQIDDQTNKTQVMTIAVHSWSPWAGANLQSMGTLPRLVSEILAQDGVQVRFRFMHWGKALDMLANNEVDAAVVWVSADLRMDPFLVSEPLEIERAALYYHTSKPYDANIYKVQHARMAWHKDYVYEYDIYNKLESHAFTPVPVATEQAGFQALLDKQADFFVVPLSEARKAVAKLSAPQQKSLGHVMLENSFPPAYFLLNASGPGIDKSQKQPDPTAIDRDRQMRQFNASLRRMLQDGRYDKIFGSAQ